MRLGVIRFTCPAIFLAAGLLLLCLASAGFAYDDFESYTNGQILATTTSNVVAGSRWGRFGSATADNPSAVTNVGVGASTAAKLSLNWGSGNNGNLVFWFDSPLDLSSAPGVAVKLLVNTTVLSNTTVRAGFEQADGTTWQTTAGQPLTNTNYASFTFNFGSSFMTRTSGSGTFSLTSARNLRLRFENTGGTGSQQILADKFGAVTSTNAVLVSDNFDIGNSFGSLPAGWAATTPAGTSIRVVDNSVTTPSSSPYCVELSDNSGTQQPEMYKNFTPTLTGSATVAVRIQSASAAPLAVKIHTSMGQFLFRLVFSSNGKMQYDNTGTNLVTTTAQWIPGLWQTVRVDWFADGTFDASLDGVQFANTVPFTNAVPSRILLAGGFDTTVNGLVYVDNVVINRQVLLSARGLFKENAIWLSGNYRSDATYVSLTPTLAQRMKNESEVTYWFVNMGSIGSDGHIVSGTSYSQVANFLNSVRTWENQHNCRFVVTAWLNNGNLAPGSSNWLDVTQASIRSNIVGECRKFTSTNVPGSFITGSTRTFDGVHLDFEPTGADTNRFNALKLLVDQIRAGLTGVGLPNGGHISFAASRYAVGSSSDRRWSPDFYYEMAQKVDALGVMLYDTTITTTGTFQSLVRDQTTNIVRAVSGAYWNNAGHPPPTNQSLVFMGFAAYPESADHDAAVENIFNAAQGADAGVTDLVNRADLSVNYFGGAIVFKHTEGTGNDGAASYTNDWQRFQEKWIWGCEECPARNDPPSIKSTLRILSILSSNDDIHLTWATVGGKTNVVQTTAGTPDGGFTNVYVDIGPPIVLPGLGEVAADYVHVGAAVSTTARYYRVRVLP